jgi:hypothetical protein
MLDQREKLPEDTMESTIPLFPCQSLEVTLEFYRALGFEVTHEQTEPYLYGAVRHGEVELHFSSLSVYGAHKAFGASLVFVSEIERDHQGFAGGLRTHYGKVPTAGLPRIGRLYKERTRFNVFDPNGNLLIYIDRREADADYTWSDEGMSGLAQALDNAIFLRDTYANDKAAARALDIALKRFVDADPLDRALALAARAEIAVALGEMERAHAVRLELQQISLSAEERERYRDELEAAEQLERWIEGTDK